MLALSCFLTSVGGVVYMHAYIGGALVLGFGVSMILYSMLVWWREVIRNATCVIAAAVFTGKDVRFDEAVVIFFFL
jgi:hypothetical protein